MLECVWHITQSTSSLTIGWKFNDNPSLNIDKKYSDSDISGGQADRIAKVHGGIKKKRLSIACKERLLLS